MIFFIRRLIACIRDNLRGFLGIQLVVATQEAGTWGSPCETLRWNVAATEIGNGRQVVAVLPS